MRNLITPIFGTRFGGYNYFDNWSEVAVFTVVSLSRSLNVPKTFEEFRTGEGERAAPCAAPRGAGTGGQRFGETGAQLCERGGNARSQLPVGALAAVPRGQTCPAPAALSRARGKGRGGGATRKARRGRGEGGPGKRGRERRAGEERGGWREKRKKEGGARLELAPKWENGESERGGGAGRAPGSRVAPRRGRPGQARVAGPAP